MQGDRPLRIFFDSSHPPFPWEKQLANSPRANSQLLFESMPTAFLYVAIRNAEGKGPYNPINGVSSAPAICSRLLSGPITRSAILRKAAICVSVGMVSEQIGRE